MCVRECHSLKKAQCLLKAKPRSYTSRSKNTIMRVEHLVMGDRRLTMEEIALTVGISVGSVHTILHEDLKMLNTDR